MELAPVAVPTDLSRQPLLVRDQTARCPSGAVRVEAVKTMFMISGWARVQSSTAGEVQLQAGSVLTIPANLSCSGFPAGHARTVTLYTQPAFLGDQIGRMPAANPLVHHLHQALDGDPGLHMLQLAASAVRDLAPSLARLARPPDSGASDFALLAGVAEVFDAVGRIAGTASADATTADALPGREVLTALTVLRSELARPWRIDALAREAALSPSQLTRLLRAQVGISPGAFLRQLRADRMAELLATSSLTVAETAAAVGWEDPAVASRSFRQRYGVAPRVYANFHRKVVTGSSASPQPSM